jgi:hypothetical protein
MDSLTTLALFLSIFVAAFIMIASGSMLYGIAASFSLQAIINVILAVGNKIEAAIEKN